MVILLASLLANSEVCPAVAGAPETTSAEGLGRGRMGRMSWAAWAEVPSGGQSHDSKQICVSVLTIEPGVQGGTEGSESTNCGVPRQGVNELVRSRYGIVIAALFPSNAQTASIVFRGRTTQTVRLKRRGFEIGRSRRIFPYLARGFAPHTCIKRIRALNAQGGAVATISSGRCLAYW